MKLFHFIPLLFFACWATAQKAGEQAVFKECAKEKLPGQCTTEKLEKDITALITGAMIEEITKGNGQHFSVSVLFITDENGKVIPSGTEIRCAGNTALLGALQNYVANLPALVPKDAKLAERRSVHIVNLTYMKNSTNSNYHIANSDELKGKILNYILADTPPVYPGCAEQDTYMAKYKCLETSLLKYFIRNYMMPEVENVGQDKMMIYMIIGNDGKLKVEKILGSSEPFRDEVYRLVKKAPAMQPALKNGIPVPMPVSVPLTLTISDK